MYCDVSVSSVAANAEQQLLVESVCVRECEKRGRTNSTRASGCVPNHSVCCLVSSLAIKYNKYSLSIVFGKIVFGFDKEPKSEKMNVSLIFGTFSLTN